MPENAKMSDFKRNFAFRKIVLLVKYMRSRVNNNNRYLAWLILCIPFLLGSCVKDDDVILDDYCYISSVRLGNVKRVVKTDSTTRHLTYNASSYLFAIDQRGDSIWNRTPLPYGSNVDAVLLNISFNGSTVAWRPVTSNNTGVWTLYTATDSINLSTPIELYVIANNSHSGRVYRMSVNVYSQDPDAFTWNKVEEFQADNGFSGMTETRATVFGGNLLVLGRTEAGLKLGRREGLGAEAQWEFLETEGLDAGTVCLNTLQQKDGKLYLSTTEGNICYSADGVTWNQTTALPGLTLIGASAQYFYGLADRKIYRTADIAEWTEEDVMEDGYPNYTPSDSLPTTVLGSQLFRQSNSNERLMLVGYMGDDAKAVVWNKMWYKNLSEEVAPWVFIPRTRDNTQQLPRLSNAVLLPYNGGCALIDATLQEVYFTNDYGITWRKDSDIKLPSELNEVTGPVAAAVSDGNVIWIIAQNQVWRGKLNRL